MAQYYSGPISQLPPAVSPVLPSNIYPATDITDLTQSPSGTTYKYSISELQQYLVTTTIGSNIQSVYLATTAPLTASYNNGMAGVGATLTNSGSLVALTVDNVTVALNNRILVKDQVSASENGIYIVTAVGSASAPWILTRAADYDGAIRTPAQGDFVGVVTGSANQLTFWFEIGAGPIIIGTSSILWAESMGQEFAFEWVYLSGTVQTASVNTGYIIGAAGLTAVTLPSTAAPGDTIRIQGSGAGGWTLQANTGQFIFMGNAGTSSGGSLSSGNRYDTIEAICIFADTLWSVGFAVSAGLTIL